MYESLTQNYNIFLGLPRLAGKGQRVLIMGMGSIEGWLEGSIRVWKHKKDGPKTEDYHADIDGDAYKEWIKDCLKLLPPNSVLVFDNAPYHSKKVENCTPRSTWKKKELQDWLKKKDIGNACFQTFQFCFIVHRIAGFLNIILLLNYDNSTLNYNRSTGTTNWHLERSSSS